MNMAVIMGMVPEMAIGTVAPETLPPGRGE
jgi:hypothetical protein